MHKILQELKPIHKQLHKLERQHRAAARCESRMRQAAESGRAGGYNHARHELRRAHDQQDALRRLAERDAYFSECVGYYDAGTSDREYAAGVVQSIRDAIAAVERMEVAL